MNSFTNDSAVSFDFGEYARKVNFTSPEQAHAFFSIEAGQFSWLESVNHQDPNLHDIVSIHLNSIRSIGRVLKEMTNQQVSFGSSTHHTEELLRLMTATYKKGGALLSSSAPGKFVQRIAKEDPDFAAYLLLFFMGRSIADPKNPMLYRAAARYELFKAGAPESLSAAELALIDLRSRYSEGISQLSGRYEEADKAFKEIEAHVGGLEGEFRSQIDNLITEYNGDFSKLKDSFSKFMNTYGAVQYWRRKQYSHGFLFVLYALLCCASTFLILHLGHDLLTSVFGLNFTDPAGANLPNWKMAVLITCALAAVWLMRILVRLMLSHAHLSSDAGERVVMVKTYLAMIKEGGSLSDKDRDLILPALFRPSATGVVKDDGVPLWWEMMFSKIKSTN